MEASRKALRAIRPAPYGTEGLGAVRVRMMRTGTDPLVPGGGMDAAVDATSGSGPRPPVRELAAGEVFTDLGTSQRGLSADRARAGLERHGANEMPRTRRRPV
nr:cation-transporting P-type ATPase [Streptomyces sp. NBC_00886]